MNISLLGLKYVTRRGREREAERERERLTERVSVKESCQAKETQIMYMFKNNKKGSNGSCQGKPWLILSLRKSNKRWFRRTIRS